MVSWFSFYFENWCVFCAENAPNRDYLAISAHDAFLTVKSKETILKWTQEYGSVPGVFLMAHNKVGCDGKRKIDVVHHVSLINDNGEGENDYLVGLLHLGGGNLMSSCLIQDVVADLVPADTKRSGTRGGNGSGKDSTAYIPPLESLIEADDERLFGKGFVPSVGEDCMTCEDIASRPSVVFVPFFVWIVICTGMNPNSSVARKQGGTRWEDESNDSDDNDEPMGKTGGNEAVQIMTHKANCPLELARCVWKRMGALHDEDALLPYPGSS